jgi:hypothetical protein
VPDRVEQFLLGPRRQGGNRFHIWLRVGLHPRLDRADLREHEVVVVVEIFRDRQAQQQIERLDPRA